MIPTEVTFEYIAETNEYTHEQVLDVTDNLEEQDIGIDAFMGPMEARWTQIARLMEQQFSQAGMAGTEVDFEGETVDETTVHTRSTVTVPPDVPEMRFLKMACIGEATQLLMLLGMADPDAREEALQFIYGVLGDGGDGD